MGNIKKYFKEQKPEKVVRILIKFVLISELNLHHFQIL